MGRFFESHEADESDVYKSERYTSPKKSSPSWPKDLYYERVAFSGSPDPLKDQIESGNISYNRLTKLLGIDDSPIRKKVGFAALDKNTYKSSPLKTEAEKFTESFRREDLSQYGLVSKMVANDFAPPQAASRDPPQPQRQDQIYIDNQEIDEQVERQRELNTSSQPSETKSLRERTNTLLNSQSELPGTKTLNEVKRRLTEMRKSKEQLDAKLHFYESKLENSAPKMQAQEQNY